jgi:hypothetical protein
MSDELLGMPEKFFVSDVPQVQETIFDKTC